MVPAVSGPLWGGVPADQQLNSQHGITLCHQRPKTNRTLLLASRYDPRCRTRAHWVSQRSTSMMSTALRQVASRQKRCYRNPIATKQARGLIEVVEW